MLPRAERMLAAIGVAVALGDRERLAALLDPKIVSAAESGGNHHAQIEANCALALALASLGRAREAQPLLERAAAAAAAAYDAIEAEEWRRDVHHVSPLPASRERRLMRSVSRRAGTSLGLPDPSAADE